MKTVLVEKDNYYFEGKVYNEKNIDKLIDKIGNRLKVIIVGESILINKVIDRYKDIEKALIAYDISNLENKDTLLDYNYDFKRGELYIYSIKQGKKVNRLIGKVRKLVVLPVQVLLKKLLKTIIKKKDYYGIMLIDKYVYIIQVEKGVMTLANTYEGDKFNLNLFVNELESIGEIIINEQLLSGKSFIDTNKKIKIINLNIKELAI